jgi:signal transduction histidine kinase
VTLDVSFDWPIVRVEIADDAKGFDLAILESGQCGLGLFRAKELLAHEGGAMQIESAPGQGTRILATVDLSHEVAA